MVGGQAPQLPYEINLQYARLSHRMNEKMSQQRLGFRYIPLLKRAGLAGALWFGLPVLLYAAIYFTFQPQYLSSFSHDFFLDSGDGYQNIWNIWWVNHSLGEHSANPYYTTMLHWPHGTSLVPQTMNIFNGLMGVVLIHLFHFNLAQAVNFAV